MPIKNPELERFQEVCTIEMVKDRSNGVARVLQVVLASSLATAGPRATAHALIRATGSVVNEVIHLQPEYRAELLKQIDALRLYVAATGQPTVS